MRKHLKEQEQLIIKKFKKILRSGSDFDVNSMCEDVANECYYTRDWIRKIVNKHYRSIITDAMVMFVKQSPLNYKSKVSEFSLKFDICEREARLILGYIKHIKDRS